MTLPSGRIRDFDNIEILNRIRNDATSDYQRRIPAATSSWRRTPLISTSSPTR